jgi:hypothetical protein
MQLITDFYQSSKESFWGKEKKSVSSETKSLKKIHPPTFPEESQRVKRNPYKKASVIGFTLCSVVAILTLLGKRVEGLQQNSDTLLCDSLEKRRLNAPEIKQTLPPLSIFPNNPIPLTEISPHTLFLDPDGEKLAITLEGLPSFITSQSVYSLLGTYNSVGNCLGLHVDQNLAYLAIDTGGFQIVDVSDPVNPVLRGSYATPAQAKDVRVVGNLAYLTLNDFGLQIINISQPNAPTLVGSYNTVGQSLAVALHQNLAYIADYPNGLVIIDVKNPTNPTLKGTYKNQAESNYATDVSLGTNTAYVANRILQIIDVTNPTTPILKGTAQYSNWIQGVEVVEKLAYTAAISTGLQIIDVTNPASPQLKGSYNVPGDYRRLRVVQNLAYVCDLNTGLKIINVSDVTSPKLVGTSKTCFDVDVGKKFAYLAASSRGLEIIEERVSLSGIPNKRDVGNYEIKIIATDPDQNSVSQILYVRVEGPPVASAPIPNKLIDVNEPFTSFIDQNAFPDPNNDIVFYSAKLSNDTPLPPWLSFSSIGIFSGTPKSSDVGVYPIKVLAFDGICKEQAVTTFSLVVDHFPKVAHPIPNEAADIQKPYNKTIPEDTFDDKDEGDTLVYTATLINGDPLPSWLSFDGLRFSGTPKSSNAGPLSIKIKATDKAGGNVETSFILTVEHFPTVVNPIGNQLAGVEKPFSFTIPSNTYNDLDDTTLTYKATKSDGTALPDWLGFNSLRQEFQGTPLPSDKGLLSLKVIAEDPKGGKATSFFTLNVVDNLGEKVIRVGTDFIYTIEDEMIENPQGPITYTVTLGNGSPLPYWMIFDPLTHAISGRAPTSSEGEYQVLVKASDGVQPEALGSVSFRVGTNAGPEVANPISNQVAQINQKYRFVVPDNTFIDSNGDKLTLSALKANGKKLPDWLKFEAASRTLEGKPSGEDTNPFTDKVESLQICATDGDQKACSFFDLSVQGTSNEERALSIFGPLASVAAFSLAWYKKRGLLINPFKKHKYDKGTIIVPIGEPFTYKLQTVVKKVKLVQAFEGKRTFGGVSVPKRLDERGWCEWLKHDRAIRGGQLMPSWLSYNERKNELSSAKGPSEEDTSTYVVRVYGYGDVILEEVKLEVGDQEKKRVDLIEKGQGTMLQPLI